MENNFFKKFLSLYFWGNILAMVIIVVLLALGLRYGLDLYTRHGQTVEVPNVVKKTFNDAEDLLDQLHLTVVVSDTDYVKTLPPNTVLEQSPSAGDIVKPGRIVYLKINSPSTPRRELPDVIDNSSMRDAQSKLTAMGFRLGETEFIPGEREWVYGIKCGGKQLASGDKVSVEDVLILQVGDGRRTLSDSITYVDSGNYYFGEEEKDEDEQQMRSRPHYRRQTESRSSNAPDWSVGAASTNVPTVPSAPETPSAPPPPTE